jgi:hypothetical protein
MKLSPDWICGFVEGEGTFCISITNAPLTQKKQVRLLFKVAQSIKNIQILYALKTFFGVGLVKSQRDQVWEFTVSRFEHLQTKIIPFFEKNTLYSSKKFDFYRFRKVSIYMGRGEHLTTEGMNKIEQIRKRMNTQESIEENFDIDEDRVRSSLKKEGK